MSIIADLDDIGRLYTKLSHDLSVEGADHARVVIEARRIVTQQVSMLLQKVGHDSAFGSHPEIAEEFRTRFREVRQKLAVLNANWRASVITGDFPGYSRDLSIITQAWMDFIQWAKGAVAT